MPDCEVPLLLRADAGPNGADAGRFFTLRVRPLESQGSNLVSHEERIVVGRSPMADLVIPDASVSPLHCEVVAERDGYVLRDLGSSRGTWLGGLRVREVFLPDEVRIGVGEVEVAFGIVGGAGAPAVPPEDRAPAIEVEHAARPTPAPFKVAKAEVVGQFEREYLTNALAAHGGNITAAARSAELDRVHFLRLLDRYGLRPSRGLKM